MSDFMIKLSLWLLLFLSTDFTKNRCNYNKGILFMLNLKSEYYVG